MMSNSSLPPELSKGSGAEAARVRWPQLDSEEPAYWQRLRRDNLVRLPTTVISAEAAHGMSVSSNIQSSHAMDIPWACFLLLSSCIASASCLGCSS